jgi:hypothetical protein
MQCKGTWIETNSDKTSGKKFSLFVGRTQPISLGEEAAAWPNGHRCNIRVNSPIYLLLFFIVNSDVLELFPFRSGAVQGDGAGFAIG